MSSWRILPPALFWKFIQLSYIGEYLNHMVAFLFPSWMIQEAHMHTHVCTYKYTVLPILYVHLYLCMHLHLKTYIYSYIFRYIHIYTYMHLYLHIHAHTFRSCLLKSIILINEIISPSIWILHQFVPLFCISTFTERRCLFWEFMEWKGNQDAIKNYQELYGSFSQVTASLAVLHCKNSSCSLN